jgi:hypothetical protein
MRTVKRTLIGVCAVLGACQGQRQREEASVAQPSSAATSGVLRVGVSDPAANIYVDSVLVGKGRLVVTLPAGSHRLLVEGDGFARIERTVMIHPGQITTESITPERKKTSIAIPNQLRLEVPAA